MSASPDHLALLAAIPLRNPLVCATPHPPDQLRLTAPLRPTFLKRLLGLTAAEKSFDLDPLGASVWHLCDGRHSVESIITTFASAHQLNLREAQVSVSMFLRTLLRRNLITLVGASSPAAARRRRKKSR